jgi:hypothetical protein
VKGEGWARVVGVEVSAPTSRPRACSWRGGDGRARAPRGSLALRGRHDSEAVCRLKGADVDWIEPDVVVWQRQFDVDYLPNQLDLVEDDYINYVELHEGYKFVNWSLDWFGLDLKLQSSKVEYPKTET